MNRTHLLLAVIATLAFVVPAAAQQTSGDPATGKPPPSRGGPGEVNGPEANGVPDDTETMALGAKAGAEAGGVAGTLTNQPIGPAPSVGVNR